MNSRRKYNKLLLALGAALLFGLSAVLAGLLQSGQSQARSALFATVKKNEQRPDHPDGAARFRRLQMQDEKGFVPPDGFEKARRHVGLMRLAQQERSNKGITIQSAGIKPDSWTWMGPSNVGGRIRAIVIQPTNANNMWVGSVGGGIWRTTDAGGNWQPVNDFMANLAVSTMVINPANTNIMYAGTGEIFTGGFNNPGNGFSPDGLLGAGIFRSTDAGVTWTQLPNTNPGNTTVCPPPATPANCPWLYVNRLAISRNGDTILAATGNGIQRSTDRGTTWTPSICPPAPCTPPACPPAPCTAQAFDIDFHPTDNLTNSERAIASGNGTARFSTDGGQTWATGIVLSGRVEVAYAPSNPTMVYALVDQNNGDLYRSTDGGANFTLMSTGTNFFQTGPPAPGSQGLYDNIIWVNPLDPTFVIVGGIDLWRSTDCGTINPSTGQVQCNFTQISRWQDSPASSAHADHHMIVAHPAFNNTTNRTAFFGNDGGIYSAGNVATVAQTSGWTNLNNNLGITQFYGAAANYNGIFIGGPQDNATLRKPFSFSQAWFGINGFGGDGGFCASDPTDPNFFYGEYIYLQISRSNDAGVSGNRIDNGLTDANNPATANFIAPFLLDPNDPNRMLAGGLNLWRCNNIKDFVFNWNLVASKPNVGNSLISAISISPSNSDFVLVGHNNGDIYRTFNGTNNSPAWSKIDPPAPALPNRFVTRLVIDNTRAPNWIYATFGGFSGDNVYRSTDLGTTWTDITGTGATGLPNVPVRSLVYHPRNPNFLYVGTEVGIFTSEDAGATWAVPQDGPANVSVDELFWFRSGAELYPSDLIAVTHGRGLYRASFGIYVDCNHMGAERGTFTEPYRTITAAINATTRYQTIWIRPCNYNERFTMPPINKGLELRSIGGTAVIGRP